LNDFESLVNVEIKKSETCLQFKKLPLKFHETNYCICFSLKKLNCHQFRSHLVINALTK